MYFSRPLACFMVVMAAAPSTALRASPQAGVQVQAPPPSPLALFEAGVNDAIAEGGAAGGLTTYERWATGMAREHERALHAVARAMLREALATSRGAVKVTILQTLAADGNTDAAAALGSEPLLEEAGAGVMAATGNERAVSALIAQLESPASSQRKRAIEGLAASKSRRAAGLIINVLNDPNPDIRMAAAKALGQLEARQAIGPLKMLLDDQVFGVHYEAAAALFAMNDLSAVAWLRQLETSEHAGIRLAAAQATRSKPDASWLGLVRELATNPDAETRRQAAELLAPHDAQGARTALEPLLSSPNVMDRAAATAAVVRTETDLAVLRRYLRHTSAEARLDAALRIMELTR